MLRCPDDVTRVAGRILEAEQDNGGRDDQQREEG